MEQTGRRWQP